MIILCDDGSLKIYVADSAKTEFWMQPHLRQANPILSLKSLNSRLFAVDPNNLLFHQLPWIVEEIQKRQQQSTESSSSTRPKSAIENNDEVATVENQPQQPRLKRANAIKKKIAKKCKLDNEEAAVATSAVTLASTQQFDIDYFEKCAQINDYELSGREILEVYNTQQLKSRLSLGNTKCVMCTCVEGFSLEITYSAASMLLTGVRVHLGTSSLERVPLFIEVLGRRVAIAKPQRARWFDVCLTRAEAFVADNKLTVRFGPSQDTRTHVTCLDALLVYAKSRDELGWSKSEAEQLQKSHSEKNLQKKSSAVTAVEKQQQTSVANKKPNTSKISVLQKKSDNKVQSEAAILATSHLQVYQPKLFDRLLGQTLHLAGNCLVLLHAKPDGGYSDESTYKVSTQLLSLLCPPIVNYKAKSLLLSALASSSSSSSSSSSFPDITSFLPLYNAYKDEAILTLVSATFKEVAEDKNENNYYLDQIYDFEQLQRVLLVCGSLVHAQRAHNLSRFATTTTGDTTNTRTFVLALNSLFWRCVSRSGCNATPSIGECQHTPPLQSLCIEALIDCMHALLLVETTTSFTPDLAEYIRNSPLVNCVFGCYIRLVCSPFIHINFFARKILLNLLKPQPLSLSKPPTQSVVKKSTNETKKSSSSSSSSIMTSKFKSKSSVDETVQFVQNSEAALGHEDTEPATTPSTLQFMSIAPYSLNEEDEMLQLAMALSLNESSQSTQSNQPPPVLPRQTFTDSAVKLPKQKLGTSSKKSYFTSKKETNAVESTNENVAFDLIRTQQPAYLQNVNSRLAVIRKVLLERMVVGIEADFLARSFISANESFTSLSGQMAATGLKAIAFFQCVLTLMADLSANESADKLMLDAILHGVLGMLQPFKELSIELKTTG